MRKKAIIIGAGIAGLSAGSYLQKNGYDTSIFELHNQPGGLCCAWKRKDYTIEGCIHWLAGSNPADPIYHFWNELIDMQSVEFVYDDEHIRMEDKDGKYIAVYTDIDRLEKEFLEKAPEDTALIRELTGAVRKFIPFVFPADKAPETFNFFDKVIFLSKLLPYMGAFRKWSKITIRDYAERCQNPLLKKTLLHTFFPDMTMFFIIITLAWKHKKFAGYPIGGSMKWAKLMEQAYLNSGGSINYNSRVKKIITSGNIATGIMLEDGKSYNADIIISAADGYATIFKMLEGKYLNDQINNYYINYEVMPSYVQVSLGVARNFDNEPQAVAFPLEQPLLVDDDVPREDIGVRIFNNDRTIAPEGKSLLTVLLITKNYSYWEDLRRKSKDEYQAKKEQIANDVINALEKRFGNIKSNIDLVDVSTPATVIRYTNNWKGSLEGWTLSPQTALIKMKKVLPGLSNFYMVGQWVEPGGGLSTSLISGRNVAQLICRDDHKKFRVND